MAFMHGVDDDTNCNNNTPFWQLFYIIIDVSCVGNLVSIVFPVNYTTKTIYIYIFLKERWNKKPFFPEIYSFRSLKKMHQCGKDELN